MNRIRVFFLLVSVAAVVSLQMIYYMTHYKKDTQLIRTNQETIYVTTRRLYQLEERIRQLPENKKELERLTAEKMAMLYAVPPFYSASKESIELMRYMHLNDFMSIDFKLVEAQENETLIKRNYELSFVGRYKDIENFLENLNSSQQEIYIESLILDNEVQQVGNEKSDVYHTYYGKDFNQLVKVVLQLTLYSRYPVGEEAEIYQPDLRMQINAEGIFALRDEKGEMINSILEKQEEVEVKSDTLFTLIVGDMLTSGDTYKLGGPGDGYGGYVGMISEGNVDIELIVTSEGYTMRMTDTNGQEEHVSIETQIESPVFDIISTMRPIYEVMPTIHVIINNQSSQEMQVNLTGSLTDHISIYDAKGNPVRKGQVKSNVRVT